MVRPIIGLFQNVAGARMWRRHLSENSYRLDAGISILEEAAKQILA
jgi:tRNA-dihydrouridine synthase A